MRTSCTPLLVDVFPYFYEVESILRRIKDKTKNTKNKNKTKKQNKTEAAAFNISFKCIDDVLSTNNPHFSTWIQLIYPKELEIKNIQMY